MVLADYTYELMVAIKALAPENAGKYCPDTWSHIKNPNSKCWKSNKILWYISVNEITSVHVLFFHRVRTQTIVFFWKHLHWDFPYHGIRIYTVILYFDTRSQNGQLSRGRRWVLHFYTSSERIARVASCIEPYFSLQIHANPSWLTVYSHRKCAATQLHSTAVNMTILT